MGKVIQVQNEEMFVYDSKLKKKKLNTHVKGKEHSCSFIFSALSKYMYSRLNFCFRAIYLHINPSFIVQKFLITSSCSLI